MVRRLPIALGASVLCVVLLSLPAAACGDKTASAGKTVKDLTPGSTQPVATDNPRDEPKLAMPASRFALGLTDLGNAWITNVPDTWVLTVDNYGKTSVFGTADEGTRLLKDWGYLGGYETGFRPEGADRAILSGSYQIANETHLFKDEDGATRAYTYFETKLKAGGAQAVAIAQVGNQSSGWKVAAGKVGNSSIDATVHRILFRRGNLVVVVATYGADPYMTPGIVRKLARMVDDKAVGQREAIEPTPTSNYTPEAVPTSTPKTSH